MASRSGGAGVGVGITITLLAIGCLALFILTIVFFSKFQRADRLLVQTRQETAEFVRDNERAGDQFQRLRQPSKDENKSVMGYLNDSLRTTMGRVTGVPNDSVGSMTAKLDSIEGATTNSLVGVIADRDAQIAQLNTQMKALDEDRKTAIADKNNEAARVDLIQDGHKQTLAALNEQLDRYKSEVEAYRAEVVKTKEVMDKKVTDTLDQAATDRSVANDKLQALANENSTLKEQISKLRKEKAPDILRPKDEFALVDGVVATVNPADGQVFINRGRKDKVVLGMSFSVYGDAAAIRPDPATGEYPRGKAQIEVTSIGEDSSTARIIPGSELRGNPVVKGDVVANAIYDPAKTYKFVVYGNFDVNRDGRPTDGELTDVKAMIQGWGGVVVDDLVGDVDFLILGAKPILPPPPRVGDPLPVVREYMRLDDIARRYDQLQQQAISTSVPVLNQNRFYTLIGKAEGFGR